MATDTTALEEEFLTCSLCLTEFDEDEHTPKILPCHHTYCQSCLKHLTLGKSTCHCPNCRKKADVPKGGPKKFQTDFRALRLKDVLQSDNKENATTRKTCKKHADQPVFFYCKDCDVSICRDCTVIDHIPEKGHNLVDLEVAQAEKNQELEQHMTAIETASTHIQEKISILDAELVNLDIAKDNALEAVDKTFSALTQQIQQRCDSLRGKIKQIHGKKVTKLNNAKKDLKQEFVKVLDCKKEITQLIQSSDICVEKSHFSITSSVSEHVRRAVDQLNLGQNLIEFNSGEAILNFNEYVKTIGEVSSLKALPSFIEFQVGSPVASIQSSIQVTVCESSKKILPDISIGLKVVQLDSNLASTGGDQYEVSVSTPFVNEKGQYVFTYVPPVSGPYVCQAIFCDRVLLNAQFIYQVQTNTPVFQFRENLNNPMAVCQTGNNICVADVNPATNEHSIVMFNSNGKFTSTFPLQVSKHQFVLHLAYMKSRQELVCLVVEEPKVDIGVPKGNTIHIYNLEGGLTQKITHKNMQDALFLSVNDNDLIVVTTESQKVLIFEPNGKLTKVLSFASNVMAFASTNDHILLINRSGVETTSINGANKKSILSFKKSGIRKISAPVAVACDQFSHILLANIVSDNVINIHTYTNDGRFLARIDNITQFYPIGRLTLTNDRHILVPNPQNQCVDKYKYM